MEDKDLTVEDWADQIKEAKSRSAIADLSMIAHRLLTAKCSLFTAKELQALIQLVVHEQEFFECDDDDFTFYSDLHCKLNLF